MPEKELHRLAIYLRDNFPKESATNEKTVDLVIDLLNELKGRRPVTEDDDVPELHPK